MTGNAPPQPSTTRIHASCVAVMGKGIVLTGPSGVGKSDLALRLIDRGAVLVSDDYTDLIVRDGRLIASPPATIAGRMEIRGIGIIAVPHLREVPVALAIQLGDKPDRMPDPLPPLMLMSLPVPQARLDAQEPSAPIKAEWLLRTLGILPA